MWEWFLAFLAWLAADPRTVNLEQPRAAAAVAAAYASMAQEEPAPPKPAPTDCVCGGTCKDGYWKPDGVIFQKCPCPAACACKQPKKAACPDGKCKK